MAGEDVIDVQSFTTQLQRELANNVTPELNKVTDISKDLNTAIIEGNIDVAIETLGSDKVKNLNTDLNASNAYFEKMKDESLKIARNLANAEQQGNLQAETQSIVGKLSERIKVVTEDIKNREEEIVPKLQAKVKQAELQLSLMDKADSNYESQKQKINQLKDGLVTANAKTADMIGQQQALIHLKENELKVVTESLENNVATKDVLKEYIKVTSDIVSNSNDQLKTNKELKDVIDGMSDAQKKLLEESKDIIAEYRGGFDAIQESITGTIDKIPLIGGLINSSIKKPLTEATEQAKSAFTTAFVKAKEVSLETGSSVKGMQAGLKEFAGGLSGIGGLISKAFLGPLMLIGVFVGFIAMAIAELGRIEGAVREMRKEFGGLAQDVQPLRDIVISVEQNLKGFGIGIEEAAASAGALRDVFADQATIQQDTVEFVAMLEEGMGIAASTGAGAVDMMMKMGAAGQKEASKVIMQTQKMSAKFGVDFKKVMEDISSASEETMIFARGSAKALAEGAVQARRMGTSINDMAAAADRLLDFESSVNAEMKASTLFGRRINLNRLRALALEGDAAGMAKEQLRIMQEMGGLRNMNRWQQKALAESMGVELSTLYNIEKTRKQDLMLRQLAAEGDANAIAALQRRQKEEAKSNLPAKEQLALKLKEQQTLESTKAIQDQFNKAMMELKQALLPIAEKLMPKILSLVKMLTGEAGEVSGIMQGMITIVQILAKPFELILGLFSALHGDTSILKGMFSDTGTVLKTLAGLTIGWFLIFKKSIPLVGGLVKGLMGGIKTAGSKLAGLFGKGGAPALPGPMKADGTPDMRFKANKNPVKSATPKSPGAKSGMGLVDSFNKIDMKKVLKGAAAMLVLSAALFVAAKAFQEFGKVTWDAVGKGIVVLGAMTTALVVMSKMLENNMGTVLKGVGIIALMGIAIIPAAYAFQMFADVGWADVFIGLGALAAFGVLAAILGAGPIPAFVAVGAGVIALLGLALIPFAYAAQMAAPAFETISNSFVNVAKSLSTLTLGEIGKLALLGASFALVGLMTPFVIGGAFAFGIMALALIAVGKALEIASPGLTALGEFLNTGAEAFNTMIDGLVKLAETESGLFGAAAGIAAVGVAMAALGVGSGVGAAVGGFGSMLGAGFNKVGSLISGDESMNEDPMTKMLKLADAGPQLEQAAASMYKLTEISSMSDEIAESMGKIGESLSVLVSTLIGFSLLGDDDPFESTFKSLEKIANISTRLNTIPKIASGFNILLSTISKNASKLGGKSVSNLSTLGESLSDMSKSIGNVDTSQLTKLPQVSEGLTLVVDVSARLTELNISEDIDDVFMGIGNGLEELSKYLDDDEIADLLKLQKLENLEGAVNVMLDLSTVDFTNITSSFESFSKSIGMLVESVNKLDIKKLKDLSILPINIGAEGPIGNQGVQGPSSLPASDPFGTTVIEGAIEPKPMMTEMADLPVVDVAGGTLPPSDPFDTPGPSLADVFSTPIAKTQVQQVAETGTTSLAEVFSTPTTETQVQQVTDTGTTSLAEVFASPPPEIVTEQKPEISILKNEKVKDAKKVNKMVQPIVDVVGSIYNKFIPDSIKQKFSDFAKNEYFNLDEDHSMEAYKRSLGVNESVTKNILGDMGVMSAKDASTLNSSNGKITENEFTSSTQYEKVAQSTGLLDQFMAGILRKELPTKLYAEGQLVGINTDTNRRMYEDENGFTKVEETTKVSVKDISDKLGNSVGSRIKMLDEAIINNTTLENDSLNKLVESRRQQLTDEKRLVVKEIQSQVEPLNTELQENATAPTSAITKIADFTTKLVPHVPVLSELGADQEQPTPTTNLELGGFDAVSVRGENIFVEELAKIVNKSATTTGTSEPHDDTKVVKKLDELIVLMRQGGISVNMDGRKVSKAISTRED